MSLYKQGAAGGGLPPPPQPPRAAHSARQAPPGGFYSAGGANPFLPPVVINTQQDSTFWNAIKYLGAGLTLWVGYEKVKELYDRNLGTSADTAESDDDAEKV